MKKKLITERKEAWTESFSEDLDNFIEEIRSLSSEGWQGISFGADDAGLVGITLTKTRLETDDEQKNRSEKEKSHREKKKAQSKKTQEREKDLYTRLKKKYEGRD